MIAGRLCRLPSNHLSVNRSGAGVFPDMGRARSRALAGMAHCYNNNLLRLFWRKSLLCRRHTARAQQHVRAGTGVSRHSGRRQHTARFVSKRHYVTKAGRAADAIMSQRHAGQPYFLMAASARVAAHSRAVDSSPFFCEADSRLS